MRFQISEFRFQIAGALLAAALLVATARVVRAEVIDRVLAVVAGQPITLSDVVGARDLGFQSADEAADPLRAILSKLIDRELMLAETDRYGPPEAEFDASVARSGIDAQHLRETVRQNLRIAAYLDQRFTAAGDRRQALIDDWIAGLRRRGNVLDLYLPDR